MVEIKKTTHKPHPKCKYCGRALFRTVEKGIRNYRGPQAFCRNVDCVKYAINQSDENSPLNDLNGGLSLDTDNDTYSSIDAPKLLQNVKEIIGGGEKYTPVILMFVLFAIELNEKLFAVHLIEKYNLHAFFGSSAKKS